MIRDLLLVLRARLTDQEEPLSMVVEALHESSRYLFASISTLLLWGICERKDFTVLEEPEGPTFLALTLMQ
jgi:hypothetical protein